MELPYSGVHGRTLIVPHLVEKEWRWLLRTPAGFSRICQASGQLDDGIVAQRRDGFQSHVSGSLDGLLMVLLEQDGADEPCDGGFIGEDADELVSDSPRQARCGYGTRGPFRCFVAREIFEPAGMSGVAHL
jgi:hypothetical protein